MAEALMLVITDIGHFLICIKPLQGSYMHGNYQIFTHRVEIPFYAIFRIEMVETNHAQLFQW